MKHILLSFIAIMTIQAQAAPYGSHVPETPLDCQADVEAYREARQRKEVISEMKRYTGRTSNEKKAIEVLKQMESENEDKLSGLEPRVTMCNVQSKASK